MMKKKKIVANNSSTTDQNNLADVIVVELNEDLILEIFSHLTPISLVRFKSVSKTWYSLISNADFLRCNTAHQFHRRWRRINDPPPPPSILLRRYDHGDSILILPPLPTQNNDQPCFYSYHQKLSPLLLQNLIDYRPEHDDEKEKFTLIDSCNGLLLYVNSIAYQIPPPRGKHIWYVCNPVTQDCIKLPTFEEEEKEKGFDILNYSSPNIVFDPSSSLTYKVVIWLRCHRRQTGGGYINYTNLQDEHYRLYVYSSETRSWRLSISTNQFPVPHQFGRFWRGVLCKGVLYWTTLIPACSSVSLCYDIEKDMISTIKFPKMPDEYRYRRLFYFGECGGSLRLVEAYYKLQFGIERINAFPSIFDVMEYLNDEELWTVKYHVNIGDHGDHNQEGYYASLIRKLSMFGVHILDLYKTKTKKAGETQEEEEVLLLRINIIGIIPFNLSNNTFGKELRNQEKNPIMRDGFLRFTEVLRFNTITLFPPSSCS